MNFSITFRACFSKGNLNLQWQPEYRYLFLKGNKCCGAKTDQWIKSFTPSILHFLLIILKSSQDMPSMETKALQCWGWDTAFYLATHWPPPAPFSSQFFWRHGCEKVEDGTTLLFSGPDCSSALSEHTKYPERTNISSELFIVYGNDNNIEICNDLINYG